jgi:lysylphosphatidylglycerol synthetase-like protein (DUF2156 family)
MFRILKNSSPINHSRQSRWLITISITFFVFIFLALFRPFELYEKSSLNPVITSACFALITLLFVSLMLFGATKYFSERMKDHWTIGHELLSSFIVVTCIGIANHSVMSYIVLPHIYYSYSPLNAFLLSLGMTYAVGFFPVSIFILVSAGLANKQHVKTSTNQEKLQENSIEAINSVVINGHSDENLVELHSDSFLFAKAAGNYVEFYSKENEVLRKELQRITLSKVDELFLKNEFPALKTHRGYIINTRKVISYQGNSQGYLLNFGEDIENVPVSRKQISDFERVMNG